MRADWADGSSSSRSLVPPNLRGEGGEKKGGEVSVKLRSGRVGAGTRVGRKAEDNKSAGGGLTSWAASEDQLTDFIIDEDEEGVREGAEPPVGPEKQKSREVGNRSGEDANRV